MDFFLVKVELSEFRLFAHVLSAYLSHHDFSFAVSNFLIIVASVVYCSFSSASSLCRIFIHQKFLTDIFQNFCKGTGGSTIQQNESESSY